MEADAMSLPKFTYGDLLGVGYLLKEFSNNAQRAIDFCVEYDLSPSMIALLEQAKVRNTRHQFLPSRHRRQHGQARS
jgi:hypothetical protein